jgi:hypothetical protein
MEIEKTIAASAKQGRGEKDRAVWEEILYTPEFYSAFLKIRALESAKVVQHRPELADCLDTFVR